jgi:hypothetical protein
MLKRYWLIVSPDDKFGPRNFGVTAFSPQQAKSLIKEALVSMAWQHISKELIDKAEIVENIDVRTLDENHVVPNMGVVSRQGVWFPNCNS